MKYCSRCGKQNESNSLFCISCGERFEVDVTGTNTDENKNTEGLGTASMIIGIIALVLSFTCIFILPVIIIFPLALVGFILGIVNKAKKGKKISGIILNGIALLISIVFVSLAITFVSSNLRRINSGNNFFDLFNGFTDNGQYNEETTDPYGLFDEFFDKFREEFDEYSNDENSDDFFNDFFNETDEGEAPNIATG